MLPYADAAAGVHEAAVVRRGGLRRHSLRAAPPAGTGAFRAALALLSYCYFTAALLLLLYYRHSLRAAPPAGTGAFRAALLLLVCY